MAFDNDKPVPKRCDILEKHALDFANLVRQARMEQSHAYAVDYNAVQDATADSIAADLFVLSMDVDEKVFDAKRLKMAGDCMARVSRLGAMATHGGRMHNWVRGICFSARATLQSVIAGDI